MPLSSRKLNHILYIEDDAGLARLLQKRMERVNLQVDLASSGEEGLERLRAHTYDLVLLDYHLPGISGLELIDTLDPLSDYPPIIILTASGNEKIALAALEKGAADYAVKDTGQFYLDLLPAIMQAAFTKDRLARENQMQKQALIDAMDKAELASQAKSEFLAMMSHEIRTPMNAVIGLSHLLGQTQLNAKQQEMVNTLSSSADLLLKIINDLLDISRIEAGHIELEAQPFAMESLIETICQMFAEQAKAKGLEMECHDHTGSHRFIGDRTRIQQILTNLVGNALKFTDQGYIHVDAYATDEGIKITVKDSGIGIPADKLDDVFEKFVQADQTITRRFGGSGLGLSICRSLADMMGGCLTVESKEGNGSCFTLTLTLPRDTSANETTDNETTREDVKNEGVILLVEDDAPNVMVATMMLEHIGYHVDVVRNGSDAVSAVNKREKPYLAILMDVQMQGMDGLETTRQIRQLEQGKNIHQHIIGVTAHALAGDKERCLQSGMDDYMSKPLHPELLAQKLKAISAT